MCCERWREGRLSPSLVQRNNGLKTARFIVATSAKSVNGGGIQAAEVQRSLPQSRFLITLGCCERRREVRNPPASHELGHLDTSACSVYVLRGICENIPPPAGYDKGLTAGATCTGVVLSLSDDVFEAEVHPLRGMLAGDPRKSAGSVEGGPYVCGCWKEGGIDRRPERFFCV